MENYYLEGIFLSNKMMIDKFMFGDESWRIQINYCIIFIMKYNIQSVWINEYVFVCYWDQSLLYINYVRGKQRECLFCSDVLIILYLYIINYVIIMYIYV